MKTDLAPFKALVKERCGLLFEGHGDEKLAQALAERGAALALGPADYHAHLLRHDAEFQELVNLLTINETYFFREPEQIRLLVERLAPRLIAAHGGPGKPEPVRILSAGCSSGEEPYSLVMALKDKYGESVDRLFAFAGGDIDSSVLVKARAARYTEFSFRGVAEDLKQRHFDRDRWAYTLKDEIRRLVSFHELNLLADSFPPALRGFDIIFFRNVSIYFDTPTRRIIQRHLASLMKEDGILVIGTAETLANDLGVLPLVEEDGLFYFVKGHPPLATAASPVSRPAFDALKIPPVSPWPLPGAVPPVSPSMAMLAKPATPLQLAPPPAAPTHASPPADLAQARRHTHDKQYAAALPLLDAVLAADPMNTEARVLKAHVLLNRKDFAAAEALAQRLLAANDWSIDALLLLGLVAKWCGQAGDAIRHFKQAAYARHECWPAHYYLADLYRQGGEIEPARRAYRVVIQLLGGTEPATGIQFLPLGLPVGEVRFLCEHQLGKLPAPKNPAGQK